MELEDVLILVLIAVVVAIGVGYQGQQFFSEVRSGLGIRAATLGAGHREELAGPVSS